jgi:hypothetical protein
MDAPRTLQHSGGAGGPKRVTRCYIQGMATPVLPFGSSAAQLHAHRASAPVQGQTLTLHAGFVAGERMSGAVTLRTPGLPVAPGAGSLHAGVLPADTIALTITL